MGRNKNIGLIAASIVICWTCSCHKSDISSTPPNNFGEDSSLAFLNYSLAGTGIKDTLSYPNIIVQFSDSVIAPGNVVASFSLPSSAAVSVGGVRQVSGVTQNNFDIPFYYTIKNQQNDSSTWEVIGTNNNYTLPWGLGQWLKLSRSNNRDYNWYIDQGSTGTCSLTNCGPSCVTMVMMWSDSTFTSNVETARNYFNDSCTDWENTLITTYMATDSIPYTLIPIGDSAAQMRDIFKAQLDSGRIIIISLTMGAIPFPTSGPNSRIDRFLTGDGDHYIILKGYRQTETDFYWEVYDPWDLGQTYPDGTPMGKDRYYPYENVAIGITNNGGGSQIAVSKKW
jgi:hypothetical protein